MEQEIEIEGYRELTVDSEAEIDGSAVALRDQETGQLFRVKRADLETALTK